MSFVKEKPQLRILWLLCYFSSRSCRLSGAKLITFYKNIKGGFQILIHLTISKKTEFNMNFYCLCEKMKKSFLKHVAIQLRFHIKGTVSVILIDLPFINRYVRL